MQSAGIGVPVPLCVRPELFQLVPVDSPLDMDRDVVVIASAALSPLRNGYVFQLPQPVPGNVPLYPAQEVLRLPLGVLIVLWLHLIGQVDLQVLRREVRMEETGQLLLPVPLVELLLGLRGGLSSGSPPASLSRIVNRVDIGIQIFAAVISLLAVDRPHALLLPVVVKL